MNAMPNPYRGFRFPAEIIGEAVWLYHCFSLSLHEVELILAARGIEVSYETILQSRRNKKGAKRFFRKLLKSYTAAKRDLKLGGEHRQSRYLNNACEVWRQATGMAQVG